MEVDTKPTVINGKDTESKVESFSLDSLPDNDPQLINVHRLADSKPGKETPIDLEQLVIDENGYVQTVKRELRVSVDHLSGDTVVSVIDGQNKDVIRQIPQDEVLAVERLITAPAGMLFRSHA